MTEIAVLIPTLGRPEKLAPLLENLAEVTAHPHRVYFVVEMTDAETRSALRHVHGTTHNVILGQFGSCAAAMNAGYRESTEPYLFTANDDLRFEPGWDIEALKIPAPIVGTNDGHGRMTCFAMVNRAFVRVNGAVFDDPDALYHEYTSQYCDTELADYAKARGQWGEAPLSVTTHLHHEFGDADPNHPNYVKARETCAADHATYERRKAEWLASLSPAPPDS